MIHLEKQEDERKKEEKEDTIYVISNRGRTYSHAHFDQFTP